MNEVSKIAIVALFGTAPTTIEALHNALDLHAPAASHSAASIRLPADPIVGSIALLGLPDDGSERSPRSDSARWVTTTFASGSFSTNIWPPDTRLT